MYHYIYIYIQFSCSQRFYDRFSCAEPVGLDEKLVEAHEQPKTTRNPRAQDFLGGLTD